MAEPPVTSTERTDSLEAEAEYKIEDGTAKLFLRGINEIIPADEVIGVVVSDGHRSLLSTKNPAVRQVPSLPEKFIDEFGLKQPTLFQNGSVDVIVSTKSGTSGAERFYSDVLKPVLQSVFEATKQTKPWTEHFTESPNTINELTKEIFAPRARDGENQTIILLSGDGGAHDILNGLKDASKSESYVKPLLGLLALGTGNALAHSLGLTRDATLGLRALLRGSLRPLGSFEAAFSPGSRVVTNEGKDREQLPVGNAICGDVVCSWGLHATLVADSDTTEYRKHGAKRFQMAAEKALQENHSYSGLVKISNDNSNDWEELEREHGYVLATLVSSLEKGFVISPDTPVPADGKLRLIRFGCLPAEETMEIMKLAYDGGKHVHDSRVTYREISRLRIEFNEKKERHRRVCVDGLIVAVEEGGWLEVRPVDTAWIDVIV